MRTFAVILPLLLVLAALAGAPVMATDFPVSETTSLQGSPAVGIDGNGGRFLVTWHDDRNPATGFDIYGRIFGPDGRPAAPDFPLVETGRDQAFSALAFDPGLDRFLVVWTDWRDARAVDSDIYGLFVSADGTRQGDEFPIARHRVSQKFPAIAFDPVRRRYLVAWTDRRHGPDETIYGRFVQSDGAFSGPEFRVSPATGDQRQPSVLFDPGHKRFLVLWWHRQDAAVDATFIDDAAVPENVPLRIVHRGAPRVTVKYAAACAPEEDRFFVVWTSDGGGVGQGLNVYGVMVDITRGEAMGTPIPIATGTAREHSAVVGYDPNSKRFLVVWLERRANPKAADIRVHGRFISVDGELSDSFPLSHAEVIAPKKSPAIGFSPRNGTFLVLWEDGQKEAIRKRQIYGVIR